MIFDTTYSLEYILGYIFIGVIITALGAIICAILRGIYIRVTKRRERERLQQQLLERLEKSVQVFEPIQDLIVYLTKEKLKEEASYFTEKGIIPLHTKTDLMSYCDKLHKIPGVNGDVTEIKNKLKELETEEVG